MIVCVSVLTKDDRKRNAISKSLDGSLKNNGRCEILPSTGSQERRRPAKNNFQCLLDCSNVDVLLVCSRQALDSHPLLSQDIHLHCCILVLVFGLLMHWNLLVLNKL